jgi:tetratricopeptide (TPR) repeat protein
MAAIILASWFGGITAPAEDLKQAREQLVSGNYAECVATAERALAAEPGNAEWQLLLSRAYIMTGQYAAAQRVITNALAQNRWNIQVCWQAREVFLCNGDVAGAKEMNEKVVGMVSRYARDYHDAPSLVAFGQAALLAGADPKRVQDTVFDTARKADPKLKEVYLASGQLALDKHDFGLAARRFEEGLKQAPGDPELECGLAQAYAPSDQGLMLNALEAALERNSNHVASLLLLVDHNIDAEDYEAAAELLARIKRVNPWRPEAWAYEAVMAHLQNQPPAEAAAREAALKFWPTNPHVDHLIGLKLSQNYRFTEGSAHQRQALQFDGDYLPAKAQLAQDLLRLGDEAEGWKLVEEVQKRDAYDVEAYNLTTLHDTMKHFTTLTNQAFIVRMSEHEAAVYGERLLELLARARTNLCAKYEVELKSPTIVEVFPQQKDFAVRTFGMPGNPGYLGVCFGRVVTATSPAAHAVHPVNWEAVLWHEFCHVVTLEMTHNKMPRWLSEGISVYEERQANPTWGERMNPHYREMTLGDDLTPLSKLSGAFLAPRSDRHLQFAYYESSLVVEFLVQRFGLERLKAILRDLGQGAEINQAIARQTAPMPELEREFADFAHARAQNFGSNLDWEHPESEKSRTTGRRNRRGQPARSELSQTNAVVISAPTPPSPSGEETRKTAAETHAKNFWVMTRQAQELVESRQWPEAKALLQQLVDSCPDVTGPESAYSLLATVHRELGETNAERQVLAQLAARDSAATEAYRRLMELSKAAAYSRGVAQSADQYLAANPLVPLPYRFLAEASEQLGETGPAIRAYRALLELEPPDLAAVHFNLARLLRIAGEPGARRQALQALEEAPRYPAALRLLLEIHSDPSAAGTGSQPQ